MPTISPQVASASPVAPAVVAGVRPAVRSSERVRPFRLGHRPAFDGFRGLAILLVLAYHLRPFSLKGGFVGVDLFFCLSGFLITALLIEEHRSHGSVDLLKFYGRRALRLFPALLLLLAGYLLAAWLWMDDWQSHARAAGLAGLYVSNWVRAFEPAGVGPPAMRWLGHTWSLSIEEQFYLVWPIVLLVLIRRYGVGGATLALCVLAAALCWAWRVSLLLGGAPPARTYNGLDVRADALLVGCGAAVLLYSGRLRLAASTATDTVAPSSTLQRMVPACFAVIVAVAIFARWKTPMSVAVFYTVPAVAAAVLLLSMLESPQGALARALSAGWLQWLGRLSYGLYLWHYPLYRIVEGELGAAWVLPVALPATVLFSAGSYYALEKPLLRFKSRLRRV